MKRKILSVLSAMLILTASILPTLVYADATAVTSVMSSETAYQGSEVIFTVTLSQAVTAKSGAISVDYPADVLEPVGGNWLTGSQIKSFDATTGKGVFVFEEATAISGALLTLTFRVKEDAAPAAATVSYDLQLRDGNSTNIACGDTAATITVLCSHASVSDAWETDANEHWHVCNGCGEAVEKATHGFDNACDTTCDACGYEREITHDMSVMNKDADGHWYTCSVCGEAGEKATHGFDNACDTTCDACGYEREITHDMTVMNKDADGHWYTCSVCGEAGEKAGHGFDDDADATCDACGYEREIAVPEIVYGDANGDDVVNGKDLLLLKQYMSKYNYATGTSSVETGAGADANGDGVINGKDLLLLKQYMAKYDYASGSSSVILGPQ